MIRVALVGLGFMGWIHWLAYKRLSGAKIVAVCESGDPRRLTGDWTMIKGNFGPPGEKVDLSGIKTTANLDEVLNDPNIAMVDLCLPPFAHADATIQALEAGKHVFVEKPMALQAADCDRMVAAAKKAGKILQVGHVLPLNPEFDFVYKAKLSGKYGKLIGGHFKRVISDPTWLQGFFDPNRIGGPMLDLHIHDAHFIRLLFGMPKQVVSQGRMRGEVVEYFNSMYQFDDPSLVVSATSGCIGQQGRTFTHAFEVHFEKATILFDFAAIGGQGVVAMPLTVCEADGTVTKPQLGSGDPVDAFQLEIDEVLKSVAAGRTSPILGGDLARDAIVLCTKETESVKTGQPVKI